MKTNKLTAYHFFLKFAGWGYDPAKESKAAGRARCARSLAEAEKRAKAAGVLFDWSRDDLTNRSFTDEGPEYLLWQCVARREAGGVVLGSLGGVDFGEAGEPWGDTYARVVEAEIASDIDYDALTEGKAEGVAPEMAVEISIDWGAGGCYSINAKNEGGQTIFGGVFPGNGQESLEAAVACVRLMAEASGGARVTGPPGLVEAVKHPGGVRGVLGLDVPGAVAVPLGFSDPVAAMGAAAQASNDTTKHLRVDLASLLERCLGFIEGFEDDDTQGEGDENVVPGLLADLRALVPVKPFKNEPCDAAEVRRSAALIAMDAAVNVSEHQKGSSLIVYGNEGGVFAVDLVHDAENVEKRLASVGTEKHPGAVVIPLPLVLAAPELRDLAELVRLENTETDVLVEKAAGIIARLQGGSVA